MQTHNHNYKINHNHRRKFDIEERRRKVAAMLAQSMTGLKIAMEMNVDNSTISRDIKVLKVMSKSFTYHLAESNLSSYYRQCIDGIEEEVRGKVLNLDKEVKNLSMKLDRMMTMDTSLGISLSAACGRGSRNEYEVDAFGNYEHKLWEQK
jgi:IS30 family transposase